MDNFFEILIYLFIIVSFINSFLKKRKKNAEKANKTAVHQEQTKETDFGVKKEEPPKDILEEIQSLFNPPVNKPKEDKQEAFGELWKTESYNEHYQKDDYHKPTETEHEMVPGEHSFTLSEHELPKVEKPEETVVTSLLDNLDDQGTNYHTCLPNHFLLQLKNKNSLKKYIVISEILGKPKALRR